MDAEEGINNHIPLRMRYILIALSYILIIVSTQRGAASEGGKYA